MRNHGFSLLELIVVMAILGILASLGAAQLRPPAARLFAVSLKAQLVQARLEAIKRNRPVSVLWDATSQSFLTQVKRDEDSTELPCETSDQTLSRQRVADFPRVRIDRAFSASVGAAAIVWYPSGLPRFCNGSVLPLVSSKVTVNDARHTRYVRVAAGGRVEVTNEE